MSERTAATWWAGQVEQLRGGEQNGAQVVLWNATAAAGPVAAGVLQLPADAVGVQELAFGLRDLLRRTLGDRSISTMVIPQDDPGGGDAEGWSRCGVAESYQPNPYDDMDDPEEYEHLVDELEGSVDEQDEETEADEDLGYV